MNCLYDYFFGYDNLYEAINDNNIEKARNLITKYKMNPIFLYIYNQTPLKMAISRYHLDIIHYLVEETSVDVTYFIKNKEAALNNAFRKGSDSIVNYLIENNADIFLGEDNLDIAILQKSIPLLQISLNNNIEPGPQHLYRSISVKSIEIYNFLREDLSNHNNNIKCDHLLYSILAQKLLILNDEWKKAIKNLIEKDNAKVNYINEYTEETPLLLCFQNGHISILQYLIDHDANISYIYKKNSLLHEACLKNNYEIIECLINNHINVDIVNHYGKKAIDYVKANEQLSNCLLLFPEYKNKKNIKEDNDESKI